MTTPRVRAALDMDVIKGNPEVVAQVLFDHREEILDFMGSVILANDPRTEDGVRVDSVAGAVHRHSGDPDDYGTCDMCVRYARKPATAYVASYEG